MIFSPLSKALLYLAFVLSIASSGHAQQFVSQRPLTYEQKEVWYDQIVPIQNSNLINGPEYFIAFNARKSNPFFGSLEQFNSQLWYNQQLYNNVNLLYDIYTDKLILRQRDKKGLFVMIELDQNKVESFTLYLHHFEKMKNPKSPEGHADNGYYDLLYAGKNLMLVAKRDKFQQTEGSNIEYKLDDSFYMIKDNHWALIKGLHDITKLINNEKEIQAFIKSKKINVRKRNESDLKALADFCDTLAESSK